MTFDGDDTPQGAILSAALAEVKRQAEAMPAEPDTTVRVVGFAVKDPAGIEIGAGAFIGDSVALTAAVRDSIRDGRLRPDTFAVLLTAKR